MSDSEIFTPLDQQLRQLSQSEDEASLNHSEDQESESSLIYESFPQPKVGGEVRHYHCIYLSSYFLRHGVFTFNPEEEDFFSFEEKGQAEIRPLGMSQKVMSKREQYLINDTVRNWVKNRPLETEGKSQLVIPESVIRTEGMDYVISLLSSHTGIEPKVFSFEEENRQSFLGFKQLLNNNRPNARLLYLNMVDLETGLVIGDALRLEKILNIDLGIQQVSEAIYSLRKSKQIDSMSLFIKANLFRFIEQARLYSKPQLIGLSENISRLLVKVLGHNPSINRISTDSVHQLAQRIVESDFQYLSQNCFVEPEALEYASATLILLGYLLEGLGGQTCILSHNAHLYGYFLNELMSEGVQLNPYYEHYFDWRTSSRELLLRLSPEDLSRSFQLSNIGEKLFVTMRGKLHEWGETEKRILWLSCFFCIPLYDTPPEVSGEILSRVYGINKREVGLIICIINLSSMNGLTGQSRFLESVDPADRGLARKLASLVQISKGLDITGRSAISSVSIEGSPHEKMVLKVFSRLDPSPELIQVQILKKNLESQFDQRIELVVDKVW
ncbi:MAG: hypothetical protein SFT81_04925 [Candidatus Caenarcaniphilales bacterium]|nr:hypothetical protein [Candidatus Caenarcaniphilales bacterium]